MTSYLTLCLLIRCDSFIAWILPELWKKVFINHYGRFVGCKLYKVCFCLPTILSEVRISDQFVNLFPLECSRAYSLKSLYRDWNTGAIQRDRSLSVRASVVGVLWWLTGSKVKVIRLNSHNTPTTSRPTQVTHSAVLTGGSRKAVFDCSTVFSK